MANHYTSEVGLSLTWGSWQEILTLLKEAWEGGAETTLHTRDWFSFREKRLFDQQAKEG